MKRRVFKTQWARFLFAGFVVCGAMFVAACRTDMHVQPRYHTMDPSPFFADGRSARPLVEGTVPRGHLRIDELLYTGKINGKDAEVFPFPITPEILQRGQERFNIFCTPCHDRTGNGNGMIVQRGFRHPPSYHIDRLRKAPVGHFFDVMTNGFGAMYSFASRIPPRDRWAIAAYIRALQLSEDATPADVPAAERSQLLNQLTPQEREPLSKGKK